MLVFTVFDKETGRNVAIQVINNPAFAALDLPRTLNIVKQEARAPVVAIEVFYCDDGRIRYKYLAEEEV